MDVEKSTYDEIDTIADRSKMKKEGNEKQKKERERGRNTQNMIAFINQNRCVFNFPIEI